MRRARPADDYKCHHDCDCDYDYHHRCHYDYDYDYDCDYDYDYDYDVGCKPFRSFIIHSQSFLMDDAIDDHLCGDTDTEGLDTSSEF